MRPLISICVPTFNRAGLLNNLFRNLAELRRVHGDAMEVCVSNNQSTDETPDVIERWRDALRINVVTQSENIGATRNFLEVSRIAKGRWLLIVGDDDELIPENFAALLNVLSSAEEADWILAGVAGPSGKEHLLGDLKDGRYGASAFRRTVLRTGLYRYGFVGMHIFPSILQQEFVGLSLAQTQPWPHVALFLRHLRKGSTRVFSPPVVAQAAGGAELFWTAEDLARITLRKVDIILEARAATRLNERFFTVLCLREMHSVSNVATLLRWKVLEPKTFRRSALHEYIARYLRLGPSMYLSAAHAIVLLAAYVAPSWLMRLGLRMAGRKHVLAKYTARRAAMSRFDGVKRGL